MEHFLVVEVWAASLTAAGAVGWLFGEAHSAGRERLSGSAKTPVDMIADSDLEHADGQDAGSQSFFTLSIPASDPDPVTHDVRAETRATPRAAKTPRRRRTDFSPMATPAPARKRTTQIKTVTDTKRCAKNADGTPVFTFGMAVGLMIFFAFCLQCMATVAIMRRETNGWKWPIAAWVYMTGLGYLGALLAYQLL